jgi:hypothetical protein
MCSTVCETTNALNPVVDKLVASNGKKIFVKLPARIDLFRNKAPAAPFPPTPVIICKGYWLTATVYYAEKFEIF